VLGPLAGYLMPAQIAAAELQVGLKPVWILLISRQETPGFQLYVDRGSVATWFCSMLHVLSAASICALVSVYFCF